MQPQVAEEFVAFDLEMTGLSPEEDRVVEIGAVRFDAHGTVLATFESLVNPQRPCGPMAFALHGIDDACLAQAPEASEVFPQFLQFLGSADQTTLLAHNAPLDAGFLGCALIRLGIALPTHHVVDTLAWSRSRWPLLSSYKLGALADRFQLDTVNTHRGLGDAQRVVGLWRALRLAATPGETPLAYPIFDGRDPIPAPIGWAQVVGAIGRDETLRIVYEGGSRGADPRLVSPRGFTHRGGVAYLVAVCHHDAREKEFRLDRVRAFEVIPAQTG